MARFHRGILRTLRGLNDGSYEGWTPSIEDLYRLQHENVVYIDKDGVVSPTGTHGGPRPRAGTNLTDLSARAAEQQNTECNVTSGTGPIRRDGFSIIDFLANSTIFPFGTPISSLDTKRPAWSPELDGNGASPLLPMELMIYNDLMTDTGETTGIFDQDFLNPASSGSTPTPSVTMENTGIVQDDPKLSAMYG